MEDGENTQESWEGERSAGSIAPFTLTRPRSEEGGADGDEQPGDGSSQRQGAHQVGGRSSGEPVFCLSLPCAARGPCHREPNLAVPQRPGRREPDVPLGKKTLRSHSNGQDGRAWRGIGRAIFQGRGVGEGRCISGRRREKNLLCFIFFICSFMNFFRGRRKHSSLFKQLLFPTVCNPRFSSWTTQLFTRKPYQQQKEVHNDIS